MKKRCNGYVYYYIFKIICVVVLGKDGVGKLGRLNIVFM